MNRQCKEVVLNLCDDESISIREYEGRVILQTDFGNDGWTYLSRQEMLSLIDGLKEIVGD